MKHLLDSEFQRKWKHFVGQGILAGGAIMLAAFSLKTLQDLVIVASLGSTAFLLFSLPSRVSCDPKHVIGGHLVGILVGLLCHRLSGLLSAELALYGIAVSLAFIVMVATDTDHPPAAGTALGVAVGGISFRDAAGVVVACMMLSFIHFLLRRHLKNLRVEAAVDEGEKPEVVAQVSDIDDSSTL